MILIRDKTAFESALHRMREARNVALEMAADAREAGDEPERQRRSATARFWQDKVNEFLA